MENLYSWLIIFCGATIALLGSFLFISERELRNKRREFDEFKRKQTTKPVDKSTEEAPSEAHASTELITRSEELARELALLASRLEESQRALRESQHEQHRLASLQSENQQLQEQIGNLTNRLETSETELSESNRQIQKVVDLNMTLKTEIFGLKQQLVEREKAIKPRQSAERHWSENQSENQKLHLEKQGLQEALDSQRIQLNSSEARLQESARRHQELSDRCARLEQEAIDFKQQLEDSQAKARQMETAQQQLANVESREMIYREQQRLEALVFDLERELSEGKNQVQALEETREHLQETERVCHELSDENRRLGEEISRWQERFAGSEENQRQVSMLRRQLEEVHSEHARLLDEKHQAQTRIAAVNEEMTSEAAIFKTNPLNDGSNETRDNSAHLSSDGSAAEIQAAKEEKSSWADWTSLKQKWRFGAVPAMVIVVIVGAAAMGLLGTLFSTSKEVVVAPATSSDENVAEPVEPVSKTKPKPKPAPRVRGTFETVRATQVYGRPSENAPLIASIGPGMKLNVVDSSNGWLEIRSKHGRPPGFIRQEAAVKIGQN